MNQIFHKIIKHIKKEYKFIIINIFLILIFIIPLPYVIYFPGNITNVSDKIIINNGYESEGSINSTYVSSITPSVPFVILALLLPNWDIETQQSQVLDNEKYEDMENRSKNYLEEANSSAIIVALDSLNISYEVTNIKNKVIYISDHKTNTLQLNDEIISIAGTQVKNIFDIQEYINKKEVGDNIEFSVLRNNVLTSATAKIILKNERKIIGIMLSTSYEVKSDYNIEMKMDKKESGPSAGLMTSLAIYDALTINDITKSNVIAGTGTIDLEGNVGSVGGIKYKLIGAAKNKVDIFIIPEDNYDEAIQINNIFKLDLSIYGVKTFNDALEVLSNY